MTGLFNAGIVALVMALRKVVCIALRVAYTEGFRKPLLMALL